MRTKIIWMYWHQGWQHAPNLVQQCRDSWIRLNPSYKVYTLDQHTLFDFVEFPDSITFDRKDLTVQKIAALARLALLSRHSGVWTDATVMCSRSLDDWLDDYYGSHFFAFRNPGPDRLMSNWFIAGDADNIIIQKLHRMFSDFYADNYFANQGTTIGKQLLERYERRWNSNAKSTLRWHSRFARERLQIYPYFIFHYTFNKLIFTDPECAALWDRAKSFSAGPPHLVQSLQSEPNGIAVAKKEIESGDAPMHKLDWRVDVSSGFWSEILLYFKERS
jgi:capsular polysaccharide synthesis protein